MSRRFPRFQLLGLDSALGAYPAIGCRARDLACIAQGLAFIRFSSGQRMLEERA
jgi:hypothetical protein